MGPTGPGGGGEVGDGAVGTDGITISGDGSDGSPLAVIPAGLANQVAVASDATIEGDGTMGSPLAVVPVALSGQVPVATDGVTVTGNGTTGSPLVATAGTVFTDGVTITGDGSEGDPLVAPGAGDSLVLVADDYAFVEDTIGNFDLFDNDEPVGEWTVHAFLVPSATLGEPPIEHFPSEASVLVAGHGTIVIRADGTGTWTPSQNVHGAIPDIVIVGRGPLGALRHSTLSITVTPVNDPPIARDINGVSIFDPVEETLTDVTIDLYGAISDPDGDAATLSLIDGAPVVYAAPIDLDGAVLTIDEDTGLGVLVLDADRTDPITFTYTCTDGTLTATGNVEILVAEVQNLPMISPVSPHNPSNIQHEERFNFFQTMLQEFGPLWPNIGPPDVEGNLTLVTIPPYGTGQGAFVLTTQEPWLYNRPRGAYLMWKATGNPEYRDVAIAWIETYFAAMGPNGTWTVGTVDPQDAKYKYPENADFYYELTEARDGPGQGSTVFYGSAESLTTAMDTSFAPEYDANSDELWTERNCAYALRAKMRRFYRSGGDEDILVDEATPYVEMILEMSLATGAPLHGHNKHEGSATLTPISSPWMCGILMEDMLQFYRHTRRQDVLEWMYNYGLWVVDEALYVADHTEEPEFAGLEDLRIPAYLAGTGVQFPEGTAADMRHARDVGVVLDKAAWAGEQLSEDVTALIAARDELWQAALVDDAYWTRNTPLYVWKRVNPPRSWMWMWGHFYALIYDTGAAPPIAPVILEAGSISGSTQQGATLTFTPPEFRGTPSPTHSWIWQLAGVDIVGTEDALTYDTADVGATTVHGVLTNEAGTVEYDSNIITVVPAGAPEISVQPVSDAAAEGDTVLFTCTFTGIPDPTAVAQLDTGGGFVTTATGTLDHDTVGDDVTATWESDPLVALDDGTLFRFLIDNGVGAPVPSDEVTISVISQQPAVATAGSTQHVLVTETAGVAGFLNWTWCGWIYVDTTANNASIIEVEGVASRRAIIQLRNGVAELTIGDSNTGGGTGWATPPPNDTWLWMTFRGPASHPGVFTATYRAQGDATTHTMTRANGIEDSVTPLMFRIGGGDAPGCAVRAQHWRVYDERFSDQQCIDEQFNYDPTEGVSGTAPVFFIVAQDAGGGTLQLVDASGNGASIINTGGVYSAAGPLTGSIS